MTKIIGIISFIIFSGLFYLIFFLNHIDIQEVGITYNSLNGYVGIQRDPGWYETSFFTTVHKISLLPRQVCFFAGQRMGSCKTVAFNATDEGIRDFIEEQGLSWNGYYSNCNNIEHQECFGVSGILRQYAFSDTKKSFLIVFDR